MRTRAILVAIALLVIVLWSAALLHERPGGRPLAFALLAGGALGVVLQRARFCFFCHARDWFVARDPRGLLAIILAIAVGLIGYTVIFGSWLPVAQPGRLPPDAHIGPISWALVLAGLAFGGGMVISGSCISAHWYRLGEGSAVAPFALLGTVIGFICGFLSWNRLYVLTIATAPSIWLPHHFGYGGALLLQLAALTGIAAWLWRGMPNVPETRRPIPRQFTAAVRALYEDRWPYWLGGLLVGLIGIFMVLRLRPLGVTAALGSLARGIAAQRGWLPERLEGLDTFGGCATLPPATWMTPNALLIIGLVAGALAAGLASRQFEPRWPTWRDVARGLIGGTLLGWGAMVGLGCTVGTLLSGTMAGALSGWLYGLSLFFAVWAGLKIERVLVPEPKRLQQRDLQQAYDTSG
jgi:uncharacterized membrane protein YedE/YeeE